MSDIDAKTSLSATSQTPPIAPNAISDADEHHAIDPSNLATYEKSLYDFLCSQGWTSTQCLCFIAQIKPMKEAISRLFYSQGCNTAQVQCLHEQCEMEFPEHFPAPKDDAEQQDLQMQLRLNEEMNRRRAIGERMYPSVGTMDRQVDEERSA
ncbi:uncharacterized protein BO88DRAFT_78910 [Aspergillus vadensis CBS 113365]|uniref:Uncharacterized protein n=1 Tax=Aspergillus vadensis (strain CBS 113365 / IMI 142717 / IBT 24658) TaxID=1448311 RepID=A0A319B3C9_ASPVC|nr:hypothetical protein BO88DRAFT_78910 [Aspergillus vadensis CBS 113365]PYH67257.1 hypothetical protein BO88DRAFT_78910 [Aspergillus vadensis CBS 113365]